MQPTLLLDESQAMRVFVDATRALSYTRPTESHWLSGPSQLMSRSWKWYSGLLLTIAISSVSHADDAEGLAFFQKKVLPVLKKHCYECHSAAADEIKGNLRVDTREGLVEGGDNGAAIVPGKVDEGFLLPVLRYEEDDYQMPPDGKLPDKVIADIQKWIAMGAPMPRPKKP